MYITDIVNDDTWGLIALTKAINAPTEGQAVPNDLDEIWYEEPLDSIDVFLERRGEELYLVPAAAYGGPGDVTTLDRAQGEVFRLIYLPTSFAVRAAEIQNQRSFGMQELESVEMRRDVKLAKARRRINGTRRFHQAKALFEGKIYDANGTTVLLDINNKFDISRQTLDIALGTEDTKVKSKLEQAKDMATDGIGDSSAIMGWRLYAGRNYHRELTDHANVREAFDRFTNGSFLAMSQANRPFVFADIEIRKFYGQMTGAAGSGLAFIDPDKAYLLPITENPEDYTTFFGPAPYLDTVNTMGLPYYATILDQNPKGMDLEACTVTLSIPRKPRAIIELTKS